MTCVHLQKLYQLCQEQDLKFSGSDLLNIVCKQCQKQEVCPSVLFDEYEANREDLPTNDEPETKPMQDHNEP